MNELAEMNPRVKHARTIVHTDRVRKGVREMLDRVYDSACALEAMGFSGVVDNLDVAINKVLDDMTAIEVAASAPTSQTQMAFIT